MGSTAHALLFVLRRFNAIGGFRSPLFLLVLIFREVLFQVVPSAVCCSTSLSLCFLIVGIHASGISIPLCLLMVSGLSLMWVASLTLRVYQCESRSLNFTPFHSERWPVLLACSETAEVWLRVKRISLSCSLFLVGSQVHRSGNNRRSFRWRCPGGPASLKQHERPSTTQVGNTCVWETGLCFTNKNNLTRKVFRPVTSEGRRKILSPHEESNLRPFRALILYLWTTETQRWARSITKFIWHASCIRVLAMLRCPC